MILLPAVDVVDGKAVRLVQGQAGSETEYGSALDAAMTWQRDGAEWIHLVDLDAAFGRGSNRELLAEVVGKLDVAVELSGGIRDDESLTAALATGCARVNLGTAALENPQWCAHVVAEHGDKVAVGLDVKIVDGGSTGCAAAAGRPTAAICGTCWNALTDEGCSRFVVTDVTKDGTLKVRTSNCCPSVAERTDAPVIASGGVSSLDDLRAIATLTDRGVEGAIVGKALYAGRFTLPQALAAVGAVDADGAGRDRSRRPGLRRPPRFWTRPRGRSSTGTAPSRRCRRRATTSLPRSTSPSNARWSRR